MLSALGRYGFDPMAPGNLNGETNSQAKAKPIETRGQQLTAMNVGNRFLFTAALGLIFFELVGSFFGQQITQAGLPIQPTLADIPFLFGLLVLVYGNFNFYNRIIEPLGESPGAELFSLFGMTAMATLPLVLFFDGLVRFRYLILGLYGVLVVLKNWELQQRFRQSELGGRFRVWKRRAVAQSVAGLVLGVLFYLLMDAHWRMRLFPLLSVKPKYQFWVTLPFNSAFLILSSVLFIVHQKDLHGLDVNQLSQKPLAVVAHDQRGGTDATGVPPEGEGPGGAAQ